MSRVGLTVERHLTAVLSDGPTQLFNFASRNGMTNRNKIQMKLNISLTGDFRNAGPLLLYFCAFGTPG